MSAHLPAEQLRACEVGHACLIQLRLKAAGALGTHANGGVGQQASSKEGAKDAARNLQDDVEDGVHDGVALGWLSAKGLVRGSQYARVVH